MKPHGTLSVVESNQAASDVYAPVSGTMAEANSALQENPTLTNNEQYTNGWMVKLEKINPAEVSGLLTPAQYKELLVGRV